MLHKNRRRRWSLLTFYKIVALLIMPLREKLNEIADNQSAMKSKLDKLHADFEAFTTVDPDSIGATPEQLDALGTRIGDLTEMIENIDPKP